MHFRQDFDKYKTQSVMKVILFKIWVYKLVDN